MCKLKDDFHIPSRVFRELANPRSGAHLHSQVPSSKDCLGYNRGGLLWNCFVYDHQLVQGVAGVTGVNDHHDPPHNRA